MLDNLHFLHPQWFWLLLLVPAVWAVRVLRVRHDAAWERVVDRQLMPFVLSGQARRAGLLPLAILSLAMLVAVVAMAGPAWQKREVPVFRNQQALVVAMDFSASMAAEDEKPNRLTLARFKLLDLLKARQDGQTGLVVFAGDAFVVAPLTDDTETIQEQVKNLTPDIMPAAGSLLEPAINRSVELLRQAGVANGQVLLITDGAADAERAAQAASAAAQAGFRVSVLALGTAEGAPIPRGQGGFIRDGAGKEVLAKTNLDALETIAHQGGGLFRHAAQGDDDLAALSAQWKVTTEGAPTTAQGRQVDTWANQGYWLVLLLLPFAAFSFRRGWLSVALLVVLFPQPHTAQAFGWNDLWQTPDQQGQRAMDAGQAATAAKLFQDPNWKAAAAYKSGDYAAASKLYQADPSANGQYNYGDALAKQGKLDDAMAAYERALKLDPKHEDASHNLALLKQKKQEQQKDQGQAGENQQQQPKSQQQEQKDASQGQDKSTSAQPEAAQKAKQLQEEQAQQAEQQKQQQAKDPADAAKSKQPAGDKPAQAAKPTKTGEEADLIREQQQATEQWLQRIPDDPAGLWRRKFQYQYQQRGNQTGGDGW